MLSGKLEGYYMQSMIIIMILFLFANKVTEHLLALYFNTYT